MALQDLTPQLRTRLSRVERAVGLFVTVATLLLVGGFAYYIYHTAERKGWFKTKISYSTSLNNAAGLKVGDPVKLMGFTVGEISSVEANAPGDYYGVTVYFRVMEPYYGYIWLDSNVRVAPADFLGNRNLEIVKGQYGVPTVLETNGAAIGVLESQRVKDAKSKLLRQLTIKFKAENPTYNEHAIQMEANLYVTNEMNRVITEKKDAFYVEPAHANACWIPPQESPALTERLETMVSSLETSLPGIFDLTNKITAVLVDADKAVTNLDLLLSQAQPVMTNAAVITANLTNANGSLGDWLINSELKTTLASLQATLKFADETLSAANTTLDHQDTNLTGVLSNLNLSMESLAGITSNLNVQVQNNTNLVKEISDAIVHADDLMQGLKRHWLLRSAFKTNKTEKATKPKKK